MSKFLCGLTLGVVIATAASGWAGVYTTGADLQAQRGKPCGDSYVLGYVAGVHDLMAGQYPVTSHTTGDISRKVAEVILEADTPRWPAAYYVVGALIRLNIIPQGDANRILPESWRNR